MTGLADGVPLVLAGPTVAVLAQLDGAERLLSDVELARAGAFRRPSDRSDFIAAHALARVCAAERLPGAEPGGLTLVQRCDRCGGAHGRPTVLEAPELSVSLAHTGGYVAAIAGDGPVGVDAERTDGRADLAAAELALNAEELRAVLAAPDPGLAFLRQWVRKEALVKVGVAAIDGMRDLDLGALPPASTAAPGYGEPGVQEPGTRPLRWDRWHLLDWWQPSAGAIGTAVAAVPPRLVTLSAS
jgi:4'-phosphopantetheinyl transferase